MKMRTRHLPDDVSEPDGLDWVLNVVNDLKPVTMSLSPRHFRRWLIAYIIEACARVIPPGYGR